MESTQNVRNICGIIDLCGEQIGNHFYVRELAAISTERNVRKPIAKFFDFKPFAFDIFLRTRRQPRLPRVYDIRELDEQIRSIYETLKRPGKELPAYKEGQCERERLTSLNIPHVDLEQFGCPRYEVIKGRRKYTRAGCRYHRLKRKHCPRSEVLTFKSWLLQHEDQI